MPPQGLRSPGSRELKTSGQLGQLEGHDLGGKDKFECNSGC